MDRNDYLSIVIVSHGSTVVIDKLTEGIRIYSQKRRREFERALEALRCNVLAFLPQFFAGK